MENLIKQIESIKFDDIIVEIDESQIRDADALDLYSEMMMYHCFDSEDGFNLKRDELVEHLKSKMK